MDLGKMNNIFDIAYCGNDSDTPVYVSKVNSNEMHRVVGVQVKKSFTENGDEKNWVEILYSEE